MKLERKVYENRSQKIGDFMLGIGISIAVNTVIGSFFSFVATLLGGFITSASNGSSASGNIVNLLLLISFAIPVLIQLGLLIYFGRTHYWIALGMLGAVAIGLLLVLLFTAVCFGMIYGLGRH